MIENSSPETAEAESGSDTAPSLPPLVASRPERIFPKLTQEQIKRVAAQGRVRRVQRGELLVEAGAAIMPFFVVKSGEIQIARLTCGSEQMIAVHHPGEFTGEVNMLSGRPSMVRARVSPRPAS